MAERAGFEPARGLRPYTISSRARSATPAPLRGHAAWEQIAARGRRSRPHQAVMAERVGFEPTVEVAPYNGFRDRRLRPLSHLSVGAEACCNRAVPHALRCRGTRLRLTSDRKIVRVTRALGKPPAGGTTVSMLLRIGSVPTLRRETPMLGYASRGRACP